jgi:uncharacterized membrane protein
MSSLPTLGRTFYAVALAAFGVQHLVHGDFVTRVVPWWPEQWAGRGVWAAVIGLALVAGGAALLARVYVRTVAWLLGGALLLSFVLLGLPLAAGDTVLGGDWTRAGKTLALSGGAWLIASAALPSARTAPAARATGSWFFGAFLALCGIQHYIHWIFVASLVPAWIPGALFWTYFTGAALVAAGIGVLVGRTARLAGLLSGLMILCWVVVLHVPRALADTVETNEVTAVFEALAMSGIGLLIAGGGRAAADGWRLMRRA